MGLFDRFFHRSRLWTDLTPGDRRLLELVTASDVQEFARLRAQWGEPFWLGVDRQTRYGDRYEVALVYDGNTVNAHSIGETVQFEIDDLFVVDRRIKTPLPCVGHVSHGILTNIICTAPRPVRWPAQLAVDDWFYVGADGTHSTSRTQDWVARIAAARAAPARVDPTVAAATPTDFRDYMGRPDRAGEIHDARLLRLPDLYFLDDPRVSGRFLVFASCADASVLAFKVPSRASGRTGVYYVSVIDGQAERVADSFTKWLEEGAPRE